MSTTTTNMGLTKPAESDTVNIGDLNGNMDTLDVHDHTGGTKGLAITKVLAGNVASRPATVTAGQVYVATDDGPSLHVADGTAWTKLGQSSAVKIAETVLAANAAIIDFQNIPQTFRHLELAIYARSDVAAIVASLVLRFNNDSSANYDYMGDGISETFATTCIYAANIPAASTDTYQYGTASIRIENYVNTTRHKVSRTFSSYKQGTNGGDLQCRSFAGFWRSASAINRIALSTSGGNLVTYTAVTLYGLP